MLQRLLRHFPSSQKLKDNRFLKPFARYLHHHFLWQFNRQSVSGGVAIGLFFGLLLPFLQVFFAALAAIIFRVNLPVAVFSTLITNPLTFPAIYYFAYRVGNVVINTFTQQTDLATDIEQVMVQQSGMFGGWLLQLNEWLHSIGWPLVIGLFLLATSSAVVAYCCILLMWKWRVRWKWHCRRQLRLHAPDE